MRRTGKVWKAGLLAMLAAGAACADPGTAISFQGELRDGGEAASGDYDFEVALYGVAENGNPIDTRQFEDVPVDIGQFEVEPDFTEVPFAAGEPYWLEVRVRPGDSSGAFVPLLPRQRITPAPYALNARSVQADAIDGAAIASGAVGAGEIDASQVQRRVGACPAGQALRSVAADGTPTCVAVGTLTEVVAGTALSGGGNAGSVVLGVAGNSIGSTQLADGGIATIDLGPNAVTAAKIDSAQVQRRVVGSCAVGASIRAVNTDGTVVCDLKGAGPVAEFSFLDVAGANGATAVVIGIDGLPFLVVHDVGDGRLLGYHCNDAACGSAGMTVIDTGNVGAYPSMMLVDGLPQIAYRDVGNSALKLAVCNDAACTAPTVRLLDNSADVGEFAQIGLGAFGWAVVAYYDRTGGDLKLAACTNLSCSTSSTLVLDDGAGNDVGRNISTFTFNRRLVVGYQDVTADRFKVSTCVVNGAACVGPSTYFADAAGSGDSSAMMLATSGRPRLLWQRGASTQTALCADANCSALTAATQVNNRAYQHLAASRDAFGHPILFGIFNNGAEQAEMWRCVDAQCSSWNLTLTFNFGVGFSMDAGVALVLGGHGAPVWAVRNGNDSRLTVCTTELCTTTMRR